MKELMDKMSTEQDADRQKFEMLLAEKNEQVGAGKRGQRELSARQLGELNARQAIRRVGRV